MSDDAKRYIYDKFGEEGLQKTWQVGPRLDQVEKIKEELEREKLKREYMENTLGIKSHGTIVTYINATSLFDDYGLEEYSDYIPEFDSMKIQQTFEKELNETSSIAAVFDLNSQNGNGDVGASAIWKQSYRDVRGEAMLGIGSNKLFRTSAYKPMGKFSWLQGSFTLPIQNLTPIYQVTFGRLLAKNCMGNITFVMSNRSIVILSVKRTSALVSANASLKVGAGVSEISCKNSMPVTDNTSLKLKGSLGNSGFVFAIGGSSQITKKTSFSYMVETGTIFGVVLKFSFTFGTQSFVLPLILSNEYSTRVSLIGSIVPYLIGYLGKKYIYDPIMLTSESRKLEEFLREREELIIKKQNEAKEAAQLMESAVMKKIEIELQSDGLIIMEARYGKLEIPSKVIDVTLPLQFLVANSQLHLHPHSKSYLIGFYDPCIGEEKELAIKYKFRSKFHFVKIHDEESLVAPLRSHIIAE